MVICVVSADAPSNHITGDGKCIIDIFSSVPGRSDLWKPAQFKSSAYRLLNKCVFAENGAGGIAEGLGQSSLCDTSSDRNK